MHVCSIMFECSQDLGLAYEVMCASYSTPVPSGPPSLAGHCKWIRNKTMCTLYNISAHICILVPGIHTGFSTTGGRQGVGSNSRVAFGQQQRTKLKSLLISKIYSGVWGGGDPMFGGGYPRAPPLLYESLSTTCSALHCYCDGNILLGRHVLIMGEMNMHSLKENQRFPDPSYVPTPLQFITHTSVCVGNFVG